MNKRQEKILHILGEENKWFTANELAKLLSVSNRTIRSDIDTINKVYSEKLITSNLRSGYALIPENNFNQNDKTYCRVPSKEIYIF